MTYDDLPDFLARGLPTLAEGPVALIFVEDLIEVAATIRHHLSLNFAAVVVFAPPELALPADIAHNIHRIRFSMLPDALCRAVNDVIRVTPGTWLYYCFNAEFLFYPFCETRSVAEMLTFQSEERRDGMLSYVVDLYAGDLKKFPDAVSLENAFLDRSGYYAQARPDAVGHPKERQLDFFGGLRWRFEEHVDLPKRKIDRISLFRSKKGLRLRPDFTFNDEEYNTYSCPWHHNITAAICSFRTAKALKTNSGSSTGIDCFLWHNSTRFNWTSQQLLDMGLMEPGQWF